KRQRIAPDFGPDFITSFHVESDTEDSDGDVQDLFLMEEDPKTYEEAMNSPEVSFWKDAIQSELDSIKSNHTWDLVDLPKGSRAKGCKWIFKKKLRTDGSVERFKARVCRYIKWM
ncbi:Uncharacterized mitochondrial protein AtMg00820, partial [Linum perenne]